MENSNTFRRARNQRGANIVESALIFLPLFALIFMIADVSMVVFLRGTLQNAVREGVRFAITYSTSYQGSPCATQSACIKQVMQANSMGFLTGANSSYINIKYYAPCALSTPLTGSTVCNTPPPPTNINFINQPGNVVEVSVTNYPWNWMVPLPGFAAGTGLTLTASAADVLQGLPVGTLVPPTP